MSTVKERVAYLEGRLEDHTTAVGGLRGSLGEVREEMKRAFEQMDRRFEQMVEQMDRRFEHVDRQFEHLDQKVDRHFTWLVGIQVAVLVAIVGTLVGSYYK